VLVEHWPQPQRGFHVPPAGFDRGELLVGGGEILRWEGLVGGAEQPFAVQVGLALHGGLVEAQQPGAGAAQVAAQPGFGLQAADQFVAAARGPGVGAVDQLSQVGHEPLAHLGVSGGGVGGVAYGEAVRADPVPADGDLFHAQVAGHGLVPARAGQRGGLGVGVAQLLGVDVVPAAAGQIRPVGRGGEAAVGDPDQPAQPPPAQVVLDRPDDRLITGVAGEGPTPHRDPVAGDRHRDDHLRQVGPVVLGVPPGAGRGLVRARQVILHGVLAQVGQLVRAVDLPVGGGGVHEHDVQVEVEQVRDRGEDLRGDLLERLEQEVHAPVGLIVAQRRQPRDRHIPRPPTGTPPACCPAAAPAGRPARRSPARSPRRPGAARPPPGAAPPRSPAAPTAGPASRPHPAAASRGSPPARRRRPRPRRPGPGTGRSRRPAGPARPGPPSRPGRSCGSPSPSTPRYPGAARCAPAAGSAPPTRPCCCAASPAGTCPPVKPLEPLLSSDTPEVVCLQVFASRDVTTQQTQALQRRSSPNLPTNCGSRARRAGSARSARAGTRRRGSRNRRPRAPRPSLLAGRTPRRGKT
jgi:hypothetical protein